MSAASFKVTFKLDEDDAKYFRSRFRKAKKAAADQDTDEILGAARDLVASVRRNKKTPGFVIEAIETLQDLTEIIEDEHYNARTSESCWTALAGREPIVEDIVACVSLGSHDVWLPYQRALLPSPRGHLTVVTKVTNENPLPFLNQA